jgi:hypothetical protein
MPWRRVRSQARALLARLFVVASALALVFGIARAGSAYFYCPVMDAIMDGPCCSRDAADRSHDGASDAEVTAPDCCERHRLGTLPQAASSAASPLVAVAAEVATPPSTEVATSAPAQASSRPPARIERAGPEPPRARVRRAKLMVFHI